VESVKEQVKVISLLFSHGKPAGLEKNGPEASGYAVNRNGIRFPGSGSSGKAAIGADMSKNASIQDALI